MGLIRQAIERRALTAGDVVRAALGSPLTTSGLRVSERNSLQIMTVFSCVKILAEGFAQVPLKLYRRQPDGSREELRGHPLYRLFHERPNDEMTSYTLRATWMEPFTQRCCWALKAFISTGSSAGQETWGAKTKRHPFICAR